MKNPDSPEEQAFQESVLEAARIKLGELVHFQVGTIEKLLTSRNFAEPENNYRFDMEHPFLGEQSRLITCFGCSIQITLEQPYTVFAGKSDVSGNEEAPYYIVQAFSDSPEANIPHVVYLIQAPSTVIVTSEDSPRQIFDEFRKLSTDTTHLENLNIFTRGVVDYFNAL